MIPDLPRGRAGAVECVLWCLLAGSATGALVAVRDDVGDAQVALIYLLIVLGGSARGGRALGLGIALFSFLAFNFFFLPPYHTLSIHGWLGWLALLSFLVTSMVAAQLLHEAQAQARVARRRADEIDRLATLGAETLNVGRAEDAAVAIARVIQSGLDVAACEIYAQDEATGRIHRVARASRGQARGGSSEPPDPNQPAQVADGSAVATRVDAGAVSRAEGDSSTLGPLLASEARTLHLPLQVRERRVGLLRLESPEPITLDESQRRFADALAYYAALALERARLTEAAEHAHALREADRLKDVLLASVSHDLRTPLTSIKALAHEMAVEGDERAMVVEEEADRLGRYVSDLLELSRLNAGTLPSAPELVAAEDVLGAALQQLTGAWERARVTATLDPAEPLLVGRFDFLHTLRALVNLIDNALKYSPTDAEVVVSARRDGDWVLFSVADHGPGVPAAEHERIFEAFVRGAGVAGVRGTGLGLAIARRAAELQGGLVEYAPRADGGSLFTLRLPAVAAADLDAMSL